MPHHLQCIFHEAPADETVGKTGHIKAATVRAGIGPAGYRCKVGIFNQRQRIRGRVSYTGMSGGVDGEPASTKHQG